MVYVDSGSVLPALRSVKIAKEKLPPSFSLLHQDHLDRTESTVSVELSNVHT
jgi:hypothetical protein